MIGKAVNLTNSSLHGSLLCYCFSHKIWVLTVL